VLLKGTAGEIISRIKQENRMKETPVLNSSCTITHACIHAQRIKHEINTMPEVVEKFLTNSRWKLITIIRAHHRIKFHISYNHV
jgi:hypothetical protein